MSTFERVMRRFGLPLYWLAFALYTLDAARNPGLVPPDAQIDYPWDGVLQTWVILALETGLFYAVLRPRTFSRSWGRLAGAFVLSLALLMAAFLSFATDMPGYVYVPGLFVLFAPAALVVVALWLAATERRREPAMRTAARAP